MTAAVVPVGMPEVIDCRAGIPDSVAVGRSVGTDTLEVAAAAEVAAAVVDEDDAAAAAAASSRA